MFSFTQVEILLTIFQQECEQIATCLDLLQSRGFNWMLVNIGNVITLSANCVRENPIYIHEICILIL
jgi:hypothetical protein